jgi:hypothetical protein
MKKLFLAATLLFSVLLFKQAEAQLSIKLNVNIGNQPTWGPTGYDHVEYYYLPDINCYYYVPGQQFVYQSGSNWITSSSLPAQYRNYDLNGGYKVVVNQPKPYLQNNVYRTKYASYKGRKGQSIIRDSHDTKYKSAGNRPGGNSRPPVNNRPNPTQGRPSTGRPSTGRPATGHPAGNQKPTGEKGKPGDGHQEDNKKDDRGRN